MLHLQQANLAVGRKGSRPR